MEPEHTHSTGGYPILAADGQGAATQIPEERADAAQTTEDFDSDLEGFTFSSSRLGNEGMSSMEDWEDRVAQDTTGYVSNPLTTSFTDLDLGPAQFELRNSAAWAELQFEIDR